MTAQHVWQKHIHIYALTYQIATAQLCCVNITHTHQYAITDHYWSLQKNKSGHYSLYGQDGYCRNVTSDSPACAWGGTLELNVTDYLRGKKKEEENKRKELEKRREKRVQAITAHWKDKKWETMTTACLSNAQSSVQVLHPPAASVLNPVRKRKEKGKHSRNQWWAVVSPAWLHGSSFLPEWKGKVRPLRHFTIDLNSWA